MTERVSASVEPWLGPRVLLVGLVILATICFLPLLGYFFSQDDFRLIYVSTHELGAELGKVFGPAPYHFRPLTEFLYFGLFYRLFGLNAFPYHVFSLLIHLCNTVLVYALLRQLRLSAGPALVATSLFGLDVAFIHAIGWISCIQQLAPEFFLLLSIIFAVFALRERSRGKQVISLFAYVMALLSMEQPFLAPVLILAIALFGLVGKDCSTRQGAGNVAPHFVVLAAYAAVRIWKGVPETGRTTFEFGTNVLDNVVTYLGASYDFWPDVTTLIRLERFEFTPSHAILAVLVAYHLIRRRVKPVLFGLLFVFATLLPTLFLVRHYDYYHTYASAFGTMYLLALALEDVFRGVSRPSIRWRRLQFVVISVAMLAFFSLSYVKVRKIEARARVEQDPTRTSFVLRRAIMAENAYRDLMTKAGNLSRVRHIYMIYGWPEVGIMEAVYTPFVWAMAHGYAVKLFFDHYGDIDVSMGPPPLPLRQLHTFDSRVFFHDRDGHCYTYGEVMKMGPRKANDGAGE